MSKTITREEFNKTINCYFRKKKLGIIPSRNKALSKKMALDEDVTPIVVEAIKDALEGILDKYPEIKAAVRVIKQKREVV